MGCSNKCNFKESKKCFRCSFIWIYNLLSFHFLSPIPSNIVILGKFDNAIRKVHTLICVLNLLLNWGLFLSNIIFIILAVPMLFELIDDLGILGIIPEVLHDFISKMFGEYPHFNLIILACNTIRFSAGKTVFFVKNYSKKMWNDIDQIWMKMLDLLSDTERKELHRFIQRLFWILCISLIFSIFFCFLIVFKMVDFIQLVDDLFGSATLEFQILFIVLLTVLASTWNCTIIYLYCVSRVVSRLFDKVNASIEIMMNNEITMEALYIIHDKHQILSELALNVDRTFSFYIFLVYFTTIPECCIALYCYLFPSGGSSPDLLLLCITFALVVFLSVALSAAEIANSAHSTYDYLCDLFIHETTSEQQSKILLLLERLSGPKIGLSCLELFIVTRSSIVNVIGMTATYFLTIIQFRGVSQTVTGNN